MTVILTILKQGLPYYTAEDRDSFIYIAQLSDVERTAREIVRAIAGSQAPRPSISELMNLEAREWRDSSGKEIKGALWVRRSDVAQLLNGAIADTQALRSRVCIHCGEESWAHCRFHEPAHCKVECAQAHHDPILATEKYELGDGEPSAPPTKFVLLCDCNYCPFCGDYVGECLGKCDGAKKYWRSGAAQEVSPPSLEPKKPGTWPDKCLQRAFVDGAAWWEWRKEKATMWQSDRKLAEAEAVRMYGKPEGDTGELTAAIAKLDELLASDEKDINVFKQKLAGIIRASAR